MITIRGKWLAQRLAAICDELGCLERLPNGGCPVCPLDKMIIEAEGLRDVIIKGKRMNLPGIKYCFDCGANLTLCREVFGGEHYCIKGVKSANPNS